MKILNICPILNENYGYHDNIFPYYQKKLGHEVLVISSIVQNLIKGERHILKKGKYLEKEVPVLRLEHYYRQGTRFIKLKGVSEILNEFKPDLIICHGILPVNILEIIKYKKKNKCKLVIDNHADLDNSAKNIFWRIVFYNIFLRGLYKLFDKYIDKYYGVTPYRMDFLINEIGIKKEKIGFLPQGYDNEEVEKIEIEKDFFKNNYNLEIKEEDIKIVFGGRIQSIKYFDRVILAVKNIREKGIKNIKIIIFGRIEDNKIKELISQNRKWIYFLGWKISEEKYKILKNSDLAIWPRHHTTLIEDCIGVALPIMIFKNRNLEYFLENENGIFLENGTTKEIQEKLEKILDKKKIEKLRKNAENFKEKLGYQLITEQFLKEIEKERKC